MSRGYPGRAQPYFEGMYSRTLMLFGFSPIQDDNGVWKQDSRAVHGGMSIPLDKFGKLASVHKEEMLWLSLGSDNSL